MRGVVIHAPKDLRVEVLPDAPLGPRDVRVKVVSGGICGSDLHYYRHGGTGTIRIREPMVLGHEVAGTVDAVGSEVTRVKPGTRVAVNPSQACGRCHACRTGLQNHCEDMRFIGSAMRFPHVQGGFREELVMAEVQMHPIADRVTMAEAAMAEPLAVCLHAMRRAGPMLGKRVVVTGCGPIGTLLVLLSRLAGALSVTATDIHDFALASARSVGADATVNVATAPEALAASAPFDVVFEASGATAALASTLPHLVPRGVVVQLGLGGDLPLPINAVVTREVDLRGSFRFGEEFGQAVELMNMGRIDLRPLITASVPMVDAVAAFELAADKSQSMKVQLEFS